MKLVSAFALVLFAVSPAAAQSWSPDGDLTLKRRSSTSPPEVRVRNAPCSLWIKDVGYPPRSLQIAQGQRISRICVPDRGPEAPGRP